MALIDKDVLATKIENRIKETESTRSMVDPFWEGQISAFDSVLKILDDLETKEEEVGLEQEIQQHINDCLDIKFPTTDIKLIAKDVEYTARKFFELGIKSK